MGFSLKLKETKWRRNKIVDTLGSNRESTGSLKALKREGQKGRRSRASMGNLMNPSFIAFWADSGHTHGEEGMHGGCNSMVNYIVATWEGLPGSVQCSQVVLKDEGVGAGLVGFEGGSGWLVSKLE